MANIEPDEGATYLEMWTVYDHPKDFPHCYVARLFIITADLVTLTPKLLIGPNIEQIRQVLAGMGLSALPRQPDDDPVIMEMWL